MEFAIGLGTVLILGEGWVYLVYKYEAKFYVWLDPILTQLVLKEIRWRHLGQIDCDKKWREKAEDKKESECDLSR